jgi:regulatory protein
MNRPRNKDIPFQPSLLSKGGFDTKTMKITALKNQKKGSRLNLEIDGKFCCGIDDSLVVELGLHSGREIDQDLLEKIKREDEYQKCLKKAFDILAIRLNSEKEIRIKLLKKFNYPTVKRVIERLIELRYINDEYFVKSWVESRERGRGAFVLKRELKQKGISEDLINSQFSDRDKENDLENARELIKKKKYDSLEGEERYKKIAGFLARRGFDYEIIKQLINK